MVVPIETTQTGEGQQAAEGCGQGPQDQVPPGQDHREGAGFGEHTGYPSEGRKLKG